MQGGDAGGDAGAGMQGKHAWRPEHVVGAGPAGRMRKLSTWATHSATALQEGAGALWSVQDTAGF